MSEDWKVHLVDTGRETQTGGRIKRLASWIGNEPFMVTYGDGVGNIDLFALLNQHQQTGATATMTAVRPPARFGHMEFDGPRVTRFHEKPQAAEGWINGGFFVCQPEVLDYIDDDQTPFETSPLEALSQAGGLYAYHHEGFWQCMDTLRDVRQLNGLWDRGEAPWAVWQHQNPNPAAGRWRPTDAAARPV
jgi:glucose-1-phosphate cytidylyltransferase